MGTEIYSVGSSNKKRSPHQLKKMIKKMRNSYQKGDKIKQSADLQHQYDEQQAQVDLEKGLEEVTTKQ